MGVPAFTFLSLESLCFPDVFDMVFSKVFAGSAGQEKAAIPVIARPRINACTS
jgi:hypothetical protein